MMKRPLSATLLALWCALSLAAVADPSPGGPASIAPESRYRLSGIITLDQARRIAVLELPDGGYTLVRQGDAFDGGEVVEIAREWLRIRDDQGERLVWLAGIRVRTGEVAGSRPVVLDRRETGQVLQRVVAPERAISAIDELGGGKAATASSVDDLLGPLLDLPAEARIVGIDHAPLGTVRESMAYVRERLRRGDVVRLNIAGNPGQEVVYLMPDNRRVDGQH